MTNTFKINTLASKTMFTIHLKLYPLNVINMSREKGSGFHEQDTAPSLPAVSNEDIEASAHAERQKDIEYLRSLVDNPKQVWVLRSDKKTWSAGMVTNYDEKGGLLHLWITDEKTNRAHPKVVHAEDFLKWQKEKGEVK